jgi:protein-tyrosine-phosphatase
MAEALAALCAQERGWWVQALSCGTEAMDGLPAAPYSQKVMREVGSDISEHLSQPVSRELVLWADRILCMELRHASLVRERIPESDTKIQLLGTFGGVMNVADPYGSWIFAYRKTRDLLRRSIDGLYDTLPPRPMPEEERRRMVAR